MAEINKIAFSQNNLARTLDAMYSAFEKQSPSRQMRPINSRGDPEPHIHFFFLGHIKLRQSMENDT